MLTTQLPPTVEGIVLFEKGIQIETDKHGKVILVFAAVNAKKTMEVIFYGRSYEPPNKKIPGERLRGFSLDGKIRNFRQVIHGDAGATALYDNYIIRVEAGEDGEGGFEYAARDRLKLADETFVKGHSGMLGGGRMSTLYPFCETLSGSAGTVPGEKGRAVVRYTEFVGIIPADVIERSASTDKSVSTTRRASGEADAPPQAKRRRAAAAPPNPKRHAAAEAAEAPEAKRRRAPGGLQQVPFPGVPTLFDAVEEEEEEEEEEVVVLLNIDHSKMDIFGDDSDEDDRHDPSLPPLRVVHGGKIHRQFEHDGPGLPALADSARYLLETAPADVPSWGETAFLEAVAARADRAEEEAARLQAENSHLRSTIAFLKTTSTPPAPVDEEKTSALLARAEAAEAALAVFEAESVALRMEMDSLRERAERETARADLSATRASGLERKLTEEILSRAEIEEAKDAFAQRVFDLEREHDETRNLLRRMAVRVLVARRSGRAGEQDALATVTAERDEIRAGLEEERDILATVTAERDELRNKFEVFKTMFST